ncbi:hypothetical protein D3C78_939260 [compost metagenome]
MLQKLFIVFTDRIVRYFSVFLEIVGPANSECPCFRIQSPGSIAVVQQQTVGVLFAVAVRILINERIEYLLLFFQCKRLLRKENPFCSTGGPHGNKFPFRLNPQLFQPIQTVSLSPNHIIPFLFKAGEGIIFSFLGLIHLPACRLLA